ncbi:MAG: hypothetical protein HXY21_06300 [Parvularculaceae bacterium]|nr:hypothetical protein [Parvularculaceae bacterium]
MDDLAISAIVIVVGWLIASGFLIAAYWRAGPMWIERHSLRFKLAGKDRRCSGAIGEMALLAACATLLWAVDATTPAMNFVAVIARHPIPALGALAFVSAIIAAYTASAVEHPDARTKKRLRQTYAIYAPYSTLLFGGGMILIYCIVTQFVADTESFGVGGARREIVELPLEPGLILGLSRRLYHMHVVRLPAQGGDWTVVNVHLSAFDEGANVRIAQLRAVLAFARAEYEKGARVVIGGDWNYEFHRPDRPTTTDEKYLFWVHPFPYAELPEGWSVAIDRETPSVRTNERPYRKGENFTTIIDGFIVSPNVRTLGVKTRDLDFEFSDHQPVDARFEAAERGPRPTRPR